MIIKKTIALDDKDIYAMVKLYLDDKGIALPETVCSVSVYRGDSVEDNKIFVSLSDEEVK